MKNLCALAFLLTLSLVSWAQEVELDVNLLIKETQITDNGDDRMQIVWWIPVEF